MVFSISFIKSTGKKIITKDHNHFKILFKMYTKQSLQTNYSREI